MPVDDGSALLPELPPLPMLAPELRSAAPDDGWPDWLGLGDDVGPGWSAEVPAAGMPLSFRGRFLVGSRSPLGDDWLGDWPCEEPLWPVEP
jgi:hypothetical protein